MDSDKKARFKVIEGGLSQSKKKADSLSYKDSLVGQSPENIDKIMALREQELKRIRPELRDVNLSLSDNLDINSFQLLFKDIFTPEYEKMQQHSILDKLSSEEEKVTKLLNLRIAQLSKQYPTIDFHYQHFLHLPEKIKDQLFAHPLMLLDDGALYLLPD